MVQDLFDFIPSELSMQPGYCNSVRYDHKLGKMCTSYVDWENQVGTPALIVAGFSQIRWVDGEYDDCGPLSRRALCVREGHDFDLMYG